MEGLPNKTLISSKHSSDSFTFSVKDAWIMDCGDYTTNYMSMKENFILAENAFRIHHHNDMEIHSKMMLQ